MRSSLVFGEFVPMFSCVGGITKKQGVELIAWNISNDVYLLHRREVTPGAKRDL
jgi:hypothetical protein